MAIDYSRLEAAVAPAKATPRVDYSPWKQLPDETLLAYYKRLAAQREGGILGTGGLMDQPKNEIVKAAQESIQEAVQESKQSSEGTSDAPSEYQQYLDSDAYEQGFSFEDYKQTNAWDRKRGAKYSGQGLLYGIPYALQSYTDSATLMADLKKAGYTEEQAKALIDDPTLGRATQQLGRTGQLATERYNYFDDGREDSLFGMAGSVVDKVFGTDIMGRQGSQSMMPLSPINSGVNLPLTDVGRAASIQAAQQKDVFDPYGRLTDFADTSDVFGVRLNKLDPYAVSAEEERQLALQLEREQQAAALLAEQEKAAAQLEAERQRREAELAAQQAEYDSMFAQQQADYDAQMAALATQADSSGSGSLLTGTATQPDSSGNYVDSISGNTYGTSTSGDNFDVGMFTSDPSVTSAYSSSTSPATTTVGGTTYTQTSTSDSSAGSVYTSSDGSKVYGGGGSQGWTPATTTTSSSSSSSGSSKWLCSKMYHLGYWTKKDAMATWRWHNAQPEVWKRGYDVWGKLLAKKVLNNKFWGSVMQAFTDKHVHGKPTTWKSVLADVMSIPCWVIGIFNRKPTSEFRIASKEEVM